MRIPLLLRESAVPQFRLPSWRDAGCLTFALGVLFAGSISSRGALSGPFYPPPLGVSFGESGTPNDGGMGLPGGKTFSFSNCNLAFNDPVYWGSVGGPKLSFQSPSYGNSGEVMGLNNIYGNEVDWYGQTTLSSVLYGTVGVSTRCRMVVNTSIIPYYNVAGLPQSVGGVVQVFYGSSWSATMYMEVYDPIGVVAIGNWVPALTFFNAAHANNSPGGAYSSFDAGFWYINQNPTISPISDITLSPGAGTGGNFSVNDLETPAASLVLSLNSDNSAILPTGNISIFGGPGSYNFSLHTVAGVAGVAHVTITVRDTDGGQASRTFTVLSDSPPFISSIANRTTQMNVSTGPIGFNVGDNESGPGPLTLSAQSSNPTLVPVSNISFGGSGFSRTVTVIPAANQYGTAFISVLVSDGYMTNGTTFQLIVNSPPNLNINNPLILPQGGTATITPSLLYAGDSDGSFSGTRFTINPDGSGGPPHNGTVMKSGVPMSTGSSFTQADINNNLITYQNNGSCDTNDDFQMGITDQNGGVWTNAGHTVLSFKIQTLLVDQPPVASNSFVSMGLGTIYNGTLVATNPDCLNQPLTYSLVILPTKGNISGFNATNGQYTYTAGAGQSGADSFTFQVSDGVNSAATPGTVSIDIENQRPIANPATCDTAQETAINSTLTGSDPDRPPQTLTYSIVANGSKGTAVITGPTTGAFSYTPQAGRFGADTFTFKINDGSTDSAPATVTVNIHVNGALPGALLVTDSGAHALFLINQTNGDVAPLSTGGLLTQPSGVAAERLGSILVGDQSNGLLRINPFTGGQTILVPHSQLQMPIGIAVEANGNILVTDPFNGVKRFNNSGTLLTNFPAGSLQVPANLTLDGSGQIYVSDAAFFVGNPAGNKIVQIDPISLNQTILSSTGLLTSPIGIVVESSGNVLSLQANDNALVRVTNPGAVQTSVSSGGSLSSAFDMTLDAAGNIFVANQGNGSVIQIDPASGAQTSILSGAPLVQPFGVGIAGTPPALRITRTALVGGQFQLQFSGIPGSSYTVFASSDVTTPQASWTALGPATETSPGQFQFTDTSGTTLALRFYLVHSP